MSEDSEQDEGVSVRDALVFKEGRTNIVYKVGTLAGSGSGETCAIICIAELGGRLIVAVPGSAWSKKVAKRKLEKTALGKAISIDVVGCSVADLESPLPEVLIKAWVGVLSMHDEARVDFSNLVPTYGFGEGILPFAEALVKVADDQFAFTAAESGGGGDGIFKRMSVVQSGLADMRDLLQSRGSGQHELWCETEGFPERREEGGWNGSPSWQGAPWQRLVLLGFPKKA